MDLEIFVQQQLHESMVFLRVDERQITHLICARLKYDLYDFFSRVLGLLPVLFLVLKAPKHP